MRAAPAAEELRACGSNSAGQLGLGDAEDRWSPAPLPPLPFQPAAVSAGGCHTLAISTNGDLWGWGEAGRGQLSDASEGGDALLPRPIAAPRQVTRVAAGWRHSLCVTADGAVWAWGDNAFGQAPAPPGQPVPLPGPAADVAAGWKHSLAVLGGGQVFAWGTGRRGELGPGAPTRGAAPPAAVAGVEGAVAAACGVQHSAALRGDGAVLTWGANKHGQLGRAGAGAGDDGVGAVPEVCAAQIASGWSHMLARGAEEGRLWAWGRADHGQGRVPAELAGAAVLAVAAGSEHALCVDAEGRLWAWGWGEHGNLGQGDVESSEAARVVATGVWGGVWGGGAVSVWSG